MEWSGAGSNRRPSTFQAGHIPSSRGSCGSFALSSVAAVNRWLLPLLSPLLSAAGPIRAVFSLDNQSCRREGRLAPMPDIDRTVDIKVNTDREMVTAEIPLAGHASEH